MKLRKSINNINKSLSASNVSFKNFQNNLIVRNFGIQNKYVHLAPCGEWWIGQKLYSSKHLASDYVKSVHINDIKNILDIENDTKISEIENTLDKFNKEELQSFYDYGFFRKNKRNNDYFLNKNDINQKE